VKQELQTGGKFNREIRRKLSDRVAGRCSRPECRRVTVGPLGDLGVLNVGEGAHITAVSSGGSRYDSGLSANQRGDVTNGIWLCATCHVLVDADPEAFPVELLREWKSRAEASARHALIHPNEEALEAGGYLELRRHEGRQRTSLRFMGVAEVDEKSAIEVVEALERTDIVYSDPIEEKLRKLQLRDKDPDAHAAGNPNRSEIPHDKRPEIAAALHASNKRLLRRASLIAEHNSAGLGRLCAILGELNASQSEKIASLVTFGALAALRMVLVLKRGFDWGGTEPTPWFESLAVETTVGPSLLPLVPKASSTGDATFSSRYWCVARVGSEAAYEYAMLPYRQVLPLFLHGIRGDRRAFFEWVLPQIFDSTRLSLKAEEGKVSAEDWEPFLLNGAYEEWWSRHRDCPWGDIKE